jgi:hypothetical protein
VITVAAQNLICPHGRTYPIKATSMDKTKINHPKNQMILLEVLLRRSPRLMWMRKKRKITET